MDATKPHAAPAADLSFTLSNPMNTAGPASAAASSLSSVSAVEVTVGPAAVSSVPTGAASKGGQATGHSRRDLFRYSAIALAVGFLLACVAVVTPIALRKTPAASTPPATVPEPVWGSFEVEPDYQWEYERYFTDLALTETAVWDESVDNGPSNWGNLKAVDGTVMYPLCKDSPTSMQSPIDIPIASAVNPPPTVPVDQHYPPQTMQVIARPGGHLGFQIKPVNATPGAGGYIRVDGIEYDFLQFHFHSAGDHSVGGEEFAMELHLVHQRRGSTGNGNLTVFAILYRLVTNANVPLQQFIADASGGPTGAIEGVVIADMLAQVEPTYYRYRGSLTTPPCTEDVRFIVTTSKVGVSHNQQLMFVASTQGIHTGRPIQPLNGRTVAAYERY